MSLLPEFLQTRLESIKNEIVYDDKVDNWFLMNSWIPVTTIVVVYLWFVLYWGPKWMADKKPFQIKNVLLVYNLTQTLYNLYIVSMLFIPDVGTLPYLIRHSCEPLPKEKNAAIWWTFATGSYLYFISKVLDLLDTVFFVLKKKQSQITFLHVYHHSMMVMATWAFLRYFKGEQGIFVGLLNCVVHVVMYSYYFLSAFGPEIQKYLWWKKYITRFQLIQFCMMCIQQFGLLIFNCNIPMALTYFIISQALLMMVLFGNFYYHSYIKKTK